MRRLLLLLLLLCSCALRCCMASEDGEQVCSSTDDASSCQHHHEDGNGTATNTNLLVVSGRRIRMPMRQSAVLPVGQEGTISRKSMTGKAYDTTSTTSFEQEEEEESSNEDFFDDEISMFSDEDCVDFEDFCEEWAQNEACIENPRYMMNTCPRSCGACETRIDLEMGEPQVIRQDHAEETWEILLSARDYLNRDVWEDEFLSMAYDACVNKDTQCAYWAAIGECDGSHRDWMSYNCAPVCATCEVMSVHTRCPLDPDAENAWGVGGVNEFFEHITTAEEFQQYEPHIWSRPDYKQGDTEETADYTIGAWLVTVENFVAEDEANRLIELGGIEGYERSTEFGDEQDDGSVAGDTVSDRRTSTNSWCDNDCAVDPVAVKLLDRMAHLAGMPSDNAESFQLLRYHPGQFYTVHHDYSEHECQRQQGPRILTVFLYLNDVEEGGGTNFPHLNLTVTPKLGRVVLWPSVLDEYPEEYDIRTEHQALPVEKGVKYGANLWFHQRNYKDPSNNGCSS